MIESNSGADLRRQVILKISPALRKIQSAHEAAWIADHVTGQPDAVEKALEIVLRRTRGEPLAYIFGSWAFREHEFRVGPGVLVPRPETEELVEFALSYARREWADFSGRKVIADFGAGSGCIGLSFVADCFTKDLRLMLVERSDQSLKWLGENVALMRPELGEARIEIVKGGWGGWPREPVDLILSNPPYVTESEFAALDESVKNFEPVDALSPNDLATFTDASGPYREILGIAELNLNAGGRIWFELGAAQAPWIKGYAESLGSFAECQTLKDMSGKERFFTAKRTASSVKV